MPRILETESEPVETGAKRSTIGGSPGDARRRNRRAPSPSFVFCILLDILALAVSGTVLVGVATAHPGLDHDIERATRLLADNPNQVDLLVQRGHLYRLDGKLIESLGDLDRARELDPNDRWVVLQRGLTLSAMGRDGEAEADLDSFLKEGGAALAYMERGRIRARTGRTQRAITDLTSAIHMQPDVESYLLRGRLQVSVGQLAEAAAGYRGGLSRLGGAVLLKEELIKVEMARARHQVALKLIDQALTQAAVKSPWHLRRAEVLAASGHPERVRAELGRALAEASRLLAKRPCGIHLVSRSRVHAAMGNLAAARQDLKLALRKSPRFKEARKLLADLERRETPKEEVESDEW
jgi:tetratricopeptide (TPR) repeat protein